jgi:hypothetical protein
MTHPLPERILQSGFGFWSARVLLSAIELGVFTELARGPRTRAQLQRRLRLDAHAAGDFLDALVSLKLLEREGDDAAAVYVNSREAAHYLDARSAADLGRWLHEGHAALAAAWDRLTDVLRSHAALGAAAPGAAHDAATRATARSATPPAAWRDEWLGPWARLFGDMLGQRLAFTHGGTLLDVQGGTADLVCALAAAQPHLQAITLAPAARLDRARARIAECRLAERVRALPLHGAWPRADTVVLNRWSPACELPLSDELALARAALEPGGRLLLIDHLLDDARRQDAAALMAILSRRMAGERVSTRTARAAQALCEAAGFARTECMALLGGASVVQAFV